MRANKQLGHIAYQQGKYVEAKKIYQNALTFVRERKNVSQISALLTTLGVLAYKQGAFTEAKRYYEEANFYYSQYLWNQ